MIIGQDVTTSWSISHEIGTQQQRDQCQNFSLGHNFCHRTVDCNQISKQMGPLNYPLIWHVTKNRPISFEICVQLQQDQCQNFNIGHNFTDKTVD